MGPPNVTGVGSSTEIPVEATTSLLPVICVASRATFTPYIRKSSLYLIHLLSQGHPLMAGSAIRASLMDAVSTKRSEPYHTPPDQEHGIDGGGPHPKRRKVRKGTRSCWECRRRKMKCIFSSPADTICVSCKRRGAKCVDQQFPEHISTPLDRSLQMGDRVVRVEALVEQLLKKMSNNSDSSCCGCATAQEGGKSNNFSSPVSVELYSRSYEPESLNVRLRHSQMRLGIQC